MLIFLVLAYSCMLTADWILSYQHTQHFKRPDRSAKISALKEPLLLWQSHVLREPSLAAPYDTYMNNVQTQPISSSRHREYPVSQS